MRLADLRPELFAAATPERRIELSRRLIVEVQTLETGPCRPPTVDRDGLGLLVTEGLLLREFSIIGRRSVDLVGPGDLLWPDEAVCFGRHRQPARWRALNKVRVTLLGGEVAEALRLAPGALAQLSRTSAARAEIPSLLAATRRVRAADRLLSMLCLVAERWGHEESHGWALPVEISHQTLGELIASERQTVTRLMKELTRAEFISRRPDRRWLVHQAAFDLLEAIVAAPDEPISALARPSLRLSAATERKAASVS